MNKTKLNENEKMVEPTAIVAIKTNPKNKVGTMGVMSKDSEGLTLGFIQEKEFEFYTENDFETNDDTPVSLQSVFDSIEPSPVEDGETIEFEKLYTLEQAKTLLIQLGFDIVKKG
jgi:hypothetical protein